MKRIGILKFAISAVTAIISMVECEAQSTDYMQMADSADYYIAHELWPQAEMTIKKALRLEPANFNNSLLLSNLGVVLTNLERYEEALESYNLALSIAPKSTVAYNNRSRTNLLLGRDDDALSDLTLSLEIDPLQEWPLQMRGLLLFYQGKIDDSKEDFSSLLHIAPTNHMAYYGLGLVAERDGNKEEAQAYYSKSLEIDEDEEVRAASIFLKLDMGRYSEAAEEIRESLARNPENPMFYLLRGCLHKLNFRNEEAEADKKNAIAKGLDSDTVERYFKAIGR